MDVPTIPYDTVYLRKVRRFLIGAGLWLIITGASVLLAAIVRCQYQVMVHIAIAWMIFIGVLGIMLALGSANKPCFVVWWFVAPLNFQTLLCIGIVLSVLTVTKSSCETKLLQEQACRRTVENSFMCSAHYFRPDSGCCNAGIPAFLIAVEVLLSMINLTIWTNHLYFQKLPARPETVVVDSSPAFLQTQEQARQRTEEITGPPTVSHWWARTPDNVYFHPTLETTRSLPPISGEEMGVEDARPGNSMLAERNFERHPLLSSPRNTTGNGTTRPPSYEEALVPRDFREVTIAELAVLYRLYSDNSS